MLPTFLAAPFAVIGAALSDSNLTEVTQIFNETNVSSGPYSPYLELT